MRFNHERFAAECRYQKVTQMDLADLWGISFSSVNSMINGKRDTMSVTRLAMACEMLKVPMAMFITKEDKDENN